MKTTIDNLLFILQEAKDQHGGDAFFCIRNDDGNKIDPISVDYMVTIRGGKQWEELYFI